MPEMAYDKPSTVATSEPGGDGIEPGSFFALDAVRSNLEYKLMRKTCMAYTLYAIFFVMFCIGSLAIPQSRQTHAAYTLAKASAGIGHSISSAETMQDANLWITSAPSAIIEKLPSYCPDCKVVQHLVDEGGKATEAKDAASPNGWLPAVKHFPRNVTYDFDNILRPIDTLFISRGGYTLFIEYSCKPMSTLAENAAAMSTNLVQCSEIYTSGAEGETVYMYWTIYLSFYAVRVGVLLFTALDWTVDKKRERAEDEARAQAEGVPNEESVYEFFQRAVMEQMTVSFLLNVIGIILPGTAISAHFNAPSDFKNVLGTNMYIICAQLFLYGRFWGPFTVIVETMLASKWQLYNFMVTLVVAFVVFAVNAHIMFGTFETGYANIFDSACTVFGHLLEPMFTEHLAEHNPTGAITFFVVTNTVFILIMSQFLIAVLCGSFDTVRDALASDVRDAQIPEGFAQITNVAKNERSKNFFFNNFLSWNHKTCGIQSQVVVEICIKLKKDTRQEVVSGEKVWEALKLRGVKDITDANNLLKRWGVNKTVAGDHRRAQDTAQAYREEIAVLIQHAKKKMGELASLKEREAAERK